MKTNLLKIFVCLFLILLNSACSHSPTKEELEAQAINNLKTSPPTAQPTQVSQEVSADWTRLDDIHAAVSYYYSEQSLKKGLPFTISDGITKTIYTLKLVAQQDQVYPTSPQTAHVQAVFDSDYNDHKITLDFEIHFRPSNAVPEGVYSVAKATVFKIGDSKPRIEFVKAGKFYEMKPSSNY